VATDVIGILRGHVLTGLPELAGRFRTAEPFPHVVIDGFLEEEVVAALVREFPPFERGDCRDEGGSPGLKSTFETVRELGAGFSRLDDVVRSPEFLGVLRELTGIEGLLYDPQYVGGGTHENLAGQELDPHVDFNYHPATGWHRRLNLLLYLNDEWREEWGGSLELHSDPWRPAEDRVTSVLPLRNRCVLFETSERSWHGFRPISPPADRPALSRRSLALYFYTRERPSNERAAAHATVYVERPLPGLAADRSLSNREVLEVRRLTARRQEHAERLYLREERLVSESRERLEQALSLGRPPGPGVLEALRRLVECQDQALRSFYDREKELSAIRELLDRLHPFRLEGLTLDGAAVGTWGDGWVGRELRLRLMSDRELSGIVVCGSLPEVAGPGQELSLGLGHGRERRTLAVGDFEWTVASRIAPGVAFDLEIGASRTFCPAASGRSEDRRELAWVLRAIRVRPAPDSGP
jgi:hypothetical protein